MRILFTDDQIDTCQLYERAFQLFGHTVRTESSAAAAIEAVSQETFDIIIVDIEMPDMNGWDAIRAIRQLPHGQAVPIVVYTSYYTPRDVDRAYAVGANDLFTKPMMPDEVNRRLEGVCAAFRKAPFSAAQDASNKSGHAMDKAAWLERLLDDR